MLSTNPARMVVTGHTTIPNYVWLERSVESN